MIASAAVVMMVVVMMVVVVRAVIVGVLLLLLLLMMIGARNSSSGRSLRLLLRADTDDCGELGVACQWLVVLHVRLLAVLILPARTTKVSEAHDFPTKVWSVLYRARRAEGILQVRVHLQLLGELGRPDLDKRGHDRLHVRARIVERDACRSERILVFVRVDADVHNPVEQIIHDLCQPLGRQLAVQRPDEHRLGRVELLRGRLDVVRVCNVPRDHLDVLRLDALRRYLEVNLGPLGRYRLAQVGHRHQRELLLIVTVRSKTV